MKPLHECAVIKNGNARVAYLVAETNILPDNDIINKKWNYVTRFAFEEFVKRDMVQGMIWENNGIKIHYNEEELAAITNRVYKKEVVDDMLKNYWNLDVTFKEKHVLLTYKDGAIACCVGAMHKLLGINMINIYMYGYVDYMFRMLKELSQLCNVEYTNEHLFRHHCDDKAYGVGHLILRLDSLAKLVNSDIINNHRLLFDTSTIKFIMANDIKSPKIPILGGKANYKKLEHYINVIDYKVKNLETLGT